MTEPITRQEFEAQGLDAPRPGEQLQCAREALDLSRDEIAAKLRLEPKVVEAIECDNYDVLPAAIFVKGYIRGYARLVGLNDTALVAAYSQSVNAPLPEIKPFESEPAKEVDSSDSRMQFVSYGMVAVILLSLGVWWKDRWDSPERPASIDDTPELGLETPANEAAIALPEGDGAVQQPSNKPAPRVRSPRSEVPIVIGSTTKDLEVSDFAGDFVDPGETQTKPEQPPQQAVVPEKKTKPVASPAPIVTVHKKKAEARVAKKDPPSGSKKELDRQDKTFPPKLANARTPQAFPTGPQHHLVLDVEAESWVQIIGRSGRRYFDGIAKAGKSINLRGEEPFKLAIGNAPDTKLRYDGKPIDLEPVTRGRVAKFVLDVKGVRRP